MAWAALTLDSWTVDSHSLATFSDLLQLAGHILHYHTVLKSHPARVEHLSGWILKHGSGLSPAGGLDTVMYGPELQAHADKLIAGKHDPHILRSHLAQLHLAC